MFSRVGRRAIRYVERLMFKLALLLVVAGCWSSGTPSPIKPPAPGAIVVDIASVSLAEDCGTDAQPADPVRPIQRSSSSRPNPASVPGSSSQSDDSRGEAACEQTTMQLSIKAGSAGAIRVKRVELLDAKGKVVGTLTPRAPSRWVDSNYQPWDQRVEAGQNLTASYALSAPTWATLPGGRDPSAAYRVRVTIAIDDEERTFDKAATIEGPALPLPEGVVT